MNIHDGRPAFPPAGKHVADGMSLRDYFAAKALQVLMHQNHGASVPVTDIANDAYVYADAMLAIRKREPR